MRPKFKRASVCAVLLLLAGLLWHCASWFSSGTLFVTYSIENDIHSVQDDVERALVDLHDLEEWQEHHDEIKGINRVLISFWIVNRSVQEASAQFYISDNCALTTARQVIDEAALVVDGISVAAGDSVHITAKESYRYFRNLDQLKRRLIEGQFCLYCIAENAPFDIEVRDGAALYFEFTYAVDWEF
jgi:hypothetical protein